MSEDMLSAEAAANAVTSARAGTPSDAGIGRAVPCSEPFRLTKREDAPVLPGSTEMDALVAFRAAARRLDAAEKELLAAREAAAAAVGRLREEAVK